MSDPAKRALIAKTYAQLNHELPIPLYAPMKADKGALWDGWLTDGDVPEVLRERLGLYIHVPYCTQVCSFCYLEKRLIDTTVPSFVDQLLSEVAELAPRFSGQGFRTLYLGGGTPGSLTVAQLDRLFTALRDAFALDDLVEFSLETDLPSLTEDKLRCYSDHGLTRLSVGLQNLDPSVLAQNNRLHAYDIEAKMGLLEKHRFRDLNLDVILGIPGSVLGNVEDTVTRALALKPSRVSLYTFNPFTNYEFDFTDAAAIDALVKGRRAQYALARSLTDAADLPDKDNLQLDDTMRAHAPLLGLGPSANNRLPHHVYYKNPDSQTYLTAPSAITGWQSTGVDAELEIHVYNCLIRSHGIDLRDVRRMFGRKPSETHDFVQQRLGTSFRLDDGVLRWTGDPGIPLHLHLLRSMNITQPQLAHGALPTPLAGLDEDHLLEVLIGY